MSLISYIGNQLIKLGRNIQGRAMSIGRVFNFTTPETFASIDQTNAVEKTFNSNIAVYVVVKKDAQKFGSIPRYVYDASTKEEKAKRIDKGPLTKLINRPNPFYSQDYFYSLARASYKVCGETFIWLNRGDISDYRLNDGSYDDKAIDKLPVLEMYVLPADMVALIPDPENLWGVLGYSLEIGEKLIMRAGDVIHWRDLNLSFDAGTREHSRGMPPGKPGAKTIEEANSLSKASMRMSQNDGAKAVLYNEILGQELTPVQESQLRRVIDAKINNNDVAGAVAAIQGKWGLLNLAMSSKDMEMIEKKKMSWTEIALLYDVPPNLVVTEQKYDNLDAAIFQWVNDSIIPGCKQLDGEMNRVLLKAFGLENTAFIATDPTELPEVMNHMIKIAKDYQEIWSISPDEIREYLGFDKWGGEFSEPWVPGDRTPINKMDDNLDEITNYLDNFNGRNGDKKEGLRTLS